jgi:LTXXQ motif family protein
MAVAGLPMASAAETGLPAETAEAPADVASTPPSATAHPKQPVFDPIAERLKYLHDRLRITPAQEPLWADLARVMQDNAKAVAPLIREQLQVTKNRTAVETLDIYERLGEVQLEGLKNFLAAFRALYDQLSDQQKIADVIFRTSPLSMVGSIPEPPRELVELPPSSPATLGAYPPSFEPLPYPPYAYHPAYPYYPYYPWPYYPWVAGPLFGLGTSFFLFPGPYHHYVFLRSHLHAGPPHAFHNYARAPHAFHPFVGAAPGFHR